MLFHFENVPYKNNKPESSVDGLTYIFCMYDTKNNIHDMYINIVDSGSGSHEMWTFLVPAQS